MKFRRHPFTALFVPIALAAVALPGMGTTVPAAERGRAEPERTVEVVIRDRVKGYETTGSSAAGIPTRIVVRNEDSVTHGFTSRLFLEVRVRMEGDGLEVRGKAAGSLGRSFHLDPGKTMTLRFTKGEKFDPFTGMAETQYYLFWCDIHPKVQGELVIVETEGAIGQRAD